MSAEAFGLLAAVGVLMAGMLVAVTLALAHSLRGEQHLSRRALGALDPLEEAELRRQHPVRRSLLRLGVAVERALDKDGETAALLQRVGWRGPERRSVFQLLRGMSAAAGLSFALLLTLAGILPSQQILLSAFAGTVLGILGPTWVLRWRAAQRQQQIAAEVPMFVHSLVLLFEAGLSTQQALGSLVREGRGVLPEIGKEVESVLRQLESGGELGAVMQHLSDGLGVEDFSTVLGVLRQMERYGGELRGPLLDALAVIEERAALGLRERVNRISGRMTVVMVLFFFPALMVFVGGPAVLALLRAFSSAALGR